MDLRTSWLKLIFPLKDPTRLPLKDRTGLNTLRLRALRLYTLALGATIAASHRYVRVPKLLK